MEEVDEAQGGHPGELNGSAAGLPDELSRRLNLKDQAPIASTSGRPPLRVLCEERHDVGESTGERWKSQDAGIVSKWRQKEKLKTTAVALVLCLNIGVDPPDVIKISPCARLECWVDPLSMQPAKALETIGKNLQSQYERWQPRAKYKMHLDPTVEDVKKLCITSRRTAKNERVLFHYNGHGVPRPTVNGEIWVFNSRYTQYIPLSIYELQNWVGNPCIYVLDCSAAGLIIHSFRALLEQRHQENRMASQGMYSPFSAAPHSVDPMKEVIVLAACGPQEVLPQKDDFPADVFTACLTTPIKVALRWFIDRTLLKGEGVITKDLIDKIPGRQTDRKTPLGELNWIFTAITDTIAWNMLPRALFQKLFRQDLLVASLFRNFLLAERIMATANCTPMSYPRLPPTHQHPMWQAWDMAAEMCLLQLPALLNDPSVEFQPSSFFSEQLTAFELWLAHGSQDKKPPEQLPIVLQVLLSQVHRLRALVLLGRFLDMGSWAVDLALSVGIFPYVLKLLQTTSTELRTTLVFIWCKILALDTSCQGDLVKDNGHQYFIRYLDTPEPTVDQKCRAQAAFVLAVICDRHPKGQALCGASGLIGILLKWLRSLGGASDWRDSHWSGGTSLLVRWLCLCLGKVCEDMLELSTAAINEGAVEALSRLLSVSDPEIRAAVVFSLGGLVHSCFEGDPGNPNKLPNHMLLEQRIISSLLHMVYDGSPLVRGEVALALARLVRGHFPLVQDALAQYQKADAARQAKVPLQPVPVTAFDSPMCCSDVAEVGGAPSVQSPQGSSVSSTTSSGPNHMCEMKQASSNNSPLLESPDSATHQQDSDIPPCTTSGRLKGDHPSSGGAGSWTEAARVKCGTVNGAPGLLGGPDTTHVGDNPSSIYTSCLEAVLLLATDPAPQVAMVGRQALKIAGVELQLVNVTTTGRSWTTSGSKSDGSVASSVAASLASTHLGGFTQKLKPRSWRSSFTSISSQGSQAKGPSSGGPGPTPQSSTPTSASPPSPNRDPHSYSRHPFILRATASMQEGLHPQNSSSSLANSSTPTSTGGPGSVGAYRSLGGVGESRAHGGSLSQMTAEGYSLEPLPPSVIYQLSCQSFSRPMLEPLASAWRETDGGSVAPWTIPLEPAKVAVRISQREASVQRCRSLVAPRLRDNIYSVNLPGAEAVSAISFHTARPLVVTTDSRGVLRVNNFLEHSLLNTFHVADGSAASDTKTPATNIVNLYQLNELDYHLVLSCAADGAVRVWRNYSTANSQRLATAWQATPIPPPPTPAPRPSVFDYSRDQGAIYSSGGLRSDVVFQWDLATEKCILQLPLRSSSVSTGAPVATVIDRLALGQKDPTRLLTSTADGCMRVYDIRVGSKPTFQLQPARSTLAGMVLEPNGRADAILAGYVSGELRLLDLRMAADADRASSSTVLRCIEAHSKGAMTAVCAHPIAGLWATGTATQMIKLWTAQGEPAGTIRPNLTSATLTHSLGPVTCITFHPVQLALAAGGRDSQCTVYFIDNVNPLPRPAS